jgi:hypothetical protein
MKDLTDTKIIAHERGLQIVDDLLAGRGGYAVDDDLEARERRSFGLHSPQMQDEADWYYQPTDEYPHEMYRGER